MELEHLRKQLQQLDQGQVEILRRLDEMADTLKDTVVEIGGVPDDWGRDPNRRSLRRRLHDLEGDREAVRIASEAVNVANDMRLNAKMNTFSRREKIIGLVLAACVAVGPYISAAIFH